ncbi:MAG: glycosyltransferase family 2 protein [Bacteroidia bacterium]|nr:glycosyltransferase family 2 protein [Bacteroidia bacterium]
MSNIELSVVVLCYRAEEEIIPFVEKLKLLLEKLTDNFEIVLVGNYFPGTTDRTKEIVEELAKHDSRLKAITKPKKGMMGWDMLEGLKAAVGEYICVIDGDGQFPIESVEKCFITIKSQNLDLVKTYRKKRFDGPYRVLISKTYNFLFQLLFPSLASKDINSKPKIIRRVALNKMQLYSTDWFIDAEIMINVRRYKMKIAEFPIQFYDIKRSSFVKIGAVFEFTKNLIVFRIKEFYIKK